MNCGEQFCHCPPGDCLADWHTADTNKEDVNMSEKFTGKLTESLSELLREMSEGNPHEEMIPDVVGREFPNEEPLRVGFKRLNENAVIPTKAHASDSGFDLYASEDVIIEPGATEIVPTGIAIELPEGYEAQVRPRSGVTSRTKLRVQLGTIDNGYNGEIGVIVDNIAPIPEEDEPYNVVKFINGYDAGRLFSDEPEGTYAILKRQRIAQLVVQPLPAVEAYEISGELGETERGGNGFGSTGVSKEAE